MAAKIVVTGLEPLGPGAEQRRIRVAAATALLGRRLVEVAVVAAQVRAPAVDDQGDRARGALDAVAAIAAEKDGRPAAALHEEDDLLVAINGIPLADAEASKADSANRKPGADAGITVMRDGKKMNMKRFGMTWYALQLEKPPASMRQAPPGQPRAGFRQKKRGGKR